MSTELKESARRVQQKLHEMGYTNKVVELADSTRTAQEAAEAIGCEVAQIAKSIVFRLDEDHALLVVASGRNRVDEKKVAKHLNLQLGKADADFVREWTGFVIGGVPPFGHTRPMTTIIDEDLFQFDSIWAAAGHPKAVFQLTPAELVSMTQGTVLTIR